MPPEASVALVGEEEPKRRSMEKLAGSASPLVDAVRFSRNFWFRAPGGWRNAYAWLPAAGTPVRATVVILHGYGEHALRYQPVGEAWAVEGLAVYAIDHAGHGENPSHGGFFGMRTVPIDSLVEDALAFARHVSTELQPGAPFFLMGHSMGGMLSFLAAIQAQDWPGFRGILLSAPTFRLGGQGLVPPGGVYKPMWTNVTCFLDTISGGYWPNPGAPVSQCTTQPGFAQRNATDSKHFGGMICVGFARRFIHATTHAASLLPELRCPFFIAHGGADTVSLPAGSALLYSAASTPEESRARKVYEGGLHEMLNSEQREAVMQDMVGWIRSRL